VEILLFWKIIVDNMTFLNLVGFIECLCKKTFHYWFGTIFFLLMWIIWVTLIDIIYRLFIFLFK